MKATTYAECVTQIRIVARHILSHLDRPLTVDDLARVAGFSPFHFQRLYRILMGETVMDTVRRLRLERSAAQLQSSTASVTEIAFDAGFDSLEAFTRAFRRAFGSPPSDFRKLEWLGSWSPSPVGLHYSEEPEPAFRPIARRGEGMSYEINQVDPIEVASMRHRGPLQFINKTWLHFADRLNAAGQDIQKLRLYTFAFDLGTGIPMDEIVGFVGVEAGMLEDWELERHTLGGGEHLVARHVGSGHLLADFWLRLWAEALPHSGRRPRSDASFQVYPNGLFAADPSTFVTDLYLPLETAHSQSGKNRAAE